MSGSDQRMISARMGATMRGDGVTFRVWAPNATRLDVVLNDDLTIPLVPDGDGLYAGHVTHAQSGDRYHFLVDGARRAPTPMRDSCQRACMARQRSSTPQPSRGLITTGRDSPWSD